jgi:hypothetical protein
VIWRRVQPYQLAVRQFITEFDAGLGPVPWEPEDLTFYSYLFTIWQGDWTRSFGRLFFDQFPLKFIACYVARRPGIDAGTVHTHAVSLRSLRVLEVSPVSRSPDGIVSTAGGQQRVEAASPLRGVGSSEGIGGAHFVEWTAWTNPAAIINPPRTFPGGLTTIERRMTFERNTVGRAVAFYRPFPEPPGREAAAEEARTELPFEEDIRQVVERGDSTSIQRAIQDIDERLGRLMQWQRLLKERLEQAKQ